MIEIRQQTETAAPPEAVFEYIVEPHNHLQFTPSLMDIHNVRSSDVGKRGEYRFKMIGTAMTGEFVDTTFDQPTERTFELRGDIEGTNSWVLTPTDDGTRIEYTATADLPGPGLLDLVTEPIARRFLQREVEATLENLTDLLEERYAPTERPA